MRLPAFVFATAALLIASGAHAQTTPPVWGAPPQVTVGSDLKDMTFNWEPVPGAVSYRLLRKLTDSPREYYAPYDETRLRETTVTIPISVHLTLWNTTRYIVLACNPAGCSRSEAVFPRDLMLDAIGFFKASNSNSKDRFGSQVALSEDGDTLAVGAPTEASDATGVNGDQANNNSPRSGAVYVYRRGDDGWAQEAYIKAPTNQPQAQFGGTPIRRQRSLALSADGATLAVGSPLQDRAGVDNAGAVYLFKRDASHTWAPQAEFTAPSAIVNDQLGYSVDLSLDGLTLKVASRSEDPGIGGGFRGRVHLWTFDGSSWNYSDLDSHWASGDYCPHSRLSGDAQTIVLYCYADSLGGGRIRTLKRTPANTWTLANNASSDWSSAGSIALDGSANWLAVRGAGFGAGGSIAMYRWENSAWVLDVSILPWSITDGGWADTMEFSSDGSYFAIGDPSAYSHGAGVADNSVIGTERHGAVLLYRQQAGRPMWASAKVIKATNPDVNDYLGAAVAMGKKGEVLAVGSPFEDSASTGVDGAQNNVRVDSGAVYLY